MIILLTFYCLIRIYRNTFLVTEVAGGIWNIITLFFLFLACIVLIGLKKSKYRFPNCVKIGLGYAFFALIHSLINIKTLSVASVYDFLMIPYFIAVVIVFFVFSQNTITDSERKVTTASFYIVLLMALYSFFLYRSGQISQPVVSDIYYPLCLLPFVLMWGNKKTIQIPIILMALGLLFSGKRAGVLAFIIAVTLYYLLLSFQDRKVKKFFKTFISFILLSIILVQLYNYTNSIYNFQTLERLQRITMLDLQDGSGSRYAIYKSVLEGLEESSLLEWIIGHGDKSVSREVNIGSLAHNDFLEIIYDYGLLPFILFVLFYFSLTIEFLRMMKKKYQHSAAFAVSLIISFFLSMFSYNMIFFASVTCTSAFWGVVLADWFRYKHQLTHQKGNRSNDAIIQ